MRRGFLCLVTLFVIMYGYEGYQLYNNLRPLICLQTGQLSDIAAKVTPLLLDTNGQGIIKNPTKIRMYQESVYVIDNHTLYCFDINGTYVGQLTSPEEIQVADYVIDSTNGQLIIFGNQDDVFYCTLEGEIRSKVKFPTESEYSRLQSVSYYNNRIWVVEEIESEANCLERVVVEYTTSFEKQHMYSLGYIPVENRNDFLCMMSPSFSVAPDTGELYVYSSPVSPEYLLQDTLAIRSAWSPSLTDLMVDIPVYPVHIGKRFCISSYATGTDSQDGYFFCYDSHTNKCWELPDGLTDNLYGTGQIRKIEPLDVSGNHYWYVSNNGVEEVPVLFILEMKS